MVATTGGPEVLASFHPAVQAWFEGRFGAPTDAQAAGWPSIRAGRDTLVCAPTGSGKTLAAFLAGIDALIRKAEAGTLTAVTEIVYVSPLKALGNDIQRNLETPLDEIREVAVDLGYDLPEITTAVSDLSRSIESAKWEPRLSRASAWISSTITVSTAPRVARERSALRYR